MISACSSLTGSDEGTNESPVEQSNTNASGYYRGHYGQSGWDDSVTDKAYTKAYPVFTSNKNENKN